MNVDKQVSDFASASHVYFKYLKTFFNYDIELEMMMLLLMLTFKKNFKSIIMSLFSSHKQILLTED